MQNGKETENIGQFFVMPRTFRTHFREFFAAAL